MSGRRLRVPTPRDRRVLMIGLAILTVGCGPAPVPSPATSPSSTPDPTPTTSTYQLNATAWYAGLVIHLIAATSVIDPAGGSVTLDLRLENPGPDLATLSVPILLASRGEAVEPSRTTAVPDVPGGSSVTATIQFDVDSTFQLNIAAFRIGRSAEHVVVIPLVEGSQQLVTLDPVVLTLKGSASAGALTVSLTGGELRADLPDWGTEMPHGTLALRLTYTARYRGSFAGGFAFTGGNVSLRLPNGSIVAARPDGHSQSVAVLAPGTPLSDLMSRFDVPVPGPGAYALVVKNGSSRSTIPFTIRTAVPGA